MDLTLDGSDLVLSSLLVFFYIRMKLVVETGSLQFLLSGYLGTDKKGQVKTTIKIYQQYPAFYLLNPCFGKIVFYLRGSKVHEYNDDIS